jgi:hypothetical protein
MVSSDPRRAADFEGRLLAEAVRACEETRGASFDDRAANAQARAAEGGLEEKILCRAGGHPLAPELSAALGRFRLSLRIVFGLGVALAFLAGLATADRALTAPPDQPVNFHWALLALLGVETLTLLFWMILSLPGGGAARIPSLGGLTLAAARGLTGRIHRGPTRTALLQSAATVYGRGAIARWTLGAITHGFWSSFLLGALVMSLLVLSAKQLVFGWETTILSEAAYLPLTRSLAALPQLAGFPTPSVAEITASRWEGQGLLPSEAAGSWAGLLIGSLLFYGLAPRVLLLAVSLVAQRRALRNFRLDLARPAYLRLRDLLMPRVRHQEAPEAGRSKPFAEPAPAAPLPRDALAGPFAFLGLEIDRARAIWPPELPGYPCLDFGLVDSRKDREEALASLRSADPSLLLVAVSLLTTPDRGIAATLGQVKRAGGKPMLLLLTEGADLERRYAAPARRQRLEDWRRLAGELELPANWVMEVDLDQAASGWPELRALLEPPPS